MHECLLTMREQGGDEWRLAHAAGFATVHLYLNVHTARDGRGPDAKQHAGFHCQRQGFIILTAANTAVQRKQQKGRRLGLRTRAAFIWHWRTATSKSSRSSASHAQVGSLCEAYCAAPHATDKNKARHRPHQHGSFRAAPAKCAATLRACSPLPSRGSSGHADAERSVCASRVHPGVTVHTHSTHSTRPCAQLVSSPWPAGGDDSATDAACTLPLRVCCARATRLLAHRGAGGGVGGKGRRQGSTSVAVNAPQHHHRLWHASQRHNTHAKRCFQGIVPLTPRPLTPPPPRLSAAALSAPGTPAWARARPRLRSAPAAAGRCRRTRRRPTAGRAAVPRRQAPRRRRPGPCRRRGWAAALPTCARAAAPGRHPRALRPMKT